ncbi:Double-stranded RNA-binding protein 1 [Camellia lanceoleosa]|uniref:Double-stranded RNA-binding protein 1 n=1 Tax=Camellia lanceoleosa TaxID=1840588 RepID=A0ACC0GLW6_9ERIC|nr:Double-stranded RNA-binding protein 1 [Camellia lanceoleosa]
MYKSKLQVLCQQNSWGLPDYYTTKDGPDHNPFFKATPLKAAMYKSKLQVLCQQNSWGLPDYYTTKDGPDHNPFFKATVIVNGVHFVTDDQYRTAKSAQNEAAKLAFDQLSAGPPPTPLPQHHLNSLQRSLIAEAQLPPSSSSDVQHLYASRLQTYTQKRKLTLPEYSYEREGPSHASRFRCRGTIDGKIYESLRFFLSIKKLNMQLQSCLGDDSTVYKNLLQELAQRKEIGGESFQGQAAKSKKATDMKAAKIAYSCLQQRNLVNPHAPNMNFPNGATVLSFSDDKWVTLKVKMN